MVRPFGLEPSTIQPFSVEGSPQIQFYVNAGRRNDVISQNIYENGAAVWPPRFFASYLPGGWAPDGVAARGSVEATEKGPHNLRI